MSALLDYRYWLNPYPVPFGPSLMGSIMVFFGWFIVISLALYALTWWNRKRKKLLADTIRPYAGLFLTTGLLGWCFLFFTYERIPLFGMRFWFLILAIHFFVKLVRLSIKVAKEYPRSVVAAQERERREKYLPKRS